ncbi:MAG: MaoC family dehydratase [Dehalococcoidales bacterium]
MANNQEQPAGLREGIELPELKKTITQQNINLYAEASQDFNPVHIDEDFARKTPLGGTVAHGMLILAYVSQMMTKAFGQKWITGGKLNVRFKDPARPGDSLTLTGKVSKLENNDDQVIVRCSIKGINEKGNPVITGDAILTTSREAPG